MGDILASPRAPPSFPLRLPRSRADAGPAVHSAVLGKAQGPMRLSSSSQGGGRAGIRREGTAPAYLGLALLLLLRWEL